MPIASPEIYKEMINNARNHNFAYPAINITSSQTLNAALKGFSDARSDGILQISTGGALYWSGAHSNDMINGAMGFAVLAKEAAKACSVNIALHTDHCPKQYLDTFLKPLITLSEKEFKKNGSPIFQSHMWDGSHESLDENLNISNLLIRRTSKINVILEVEIGVVGGEEDGISNKINDQLYSNIKDAYKTAKLLGLNERDNKRYLAAFTFGNVHGVYKPGKVKLRPKILKNIQKFVGKKFKLNKPFDLVFHGGSGSSLDDIKKSISYGVIKMNIDTDMQYSFTRPIVDYLFKNYDQVIKVDGNIGNKKKYDPRTWGKLAEKNFSYRLTEIANQLGSAGHTITDS